MVSVGTRRMPAKGLIIIGILVAASPAIAQTSTAVIVSQSSTGDLQIDVPPPLDFHGSLSIAVAPGTSPAITADPVIPSGYVIAFQTPSGELSIVSGNITFGSNSPMGTGLLMKAGTSPSIAISGASYKVAFQSSTGDLWTLSSLDGPANLHLGMMAGTSPSITGLSTGGYEIAVQANTGALWTVSPAGSGAPTTGNMKAGTSPSIAEVSPGGYQIAFQASTGELQIIDSLGASTNTGLGMMAGTSPSIAALLLGGYEIAFQANTGVLWTVAPNNGGIPVGASTGLGMKAGTSPAIAAVQGGAEIAFQANTGALWLVPPGGVGTPTLQDMKAGTSPGATLTAVIN